MKKRYIRFMQKKDQEMKDLGELSSALKPALNAYVLNPSAKEKTIRGEHSKEGRKSEK